MCRRKLVPFLVLTGSITAFASTSPIPVSLANGVPTSVDYMTFNSNSFPGANLVCPPNAAGCGGAFQAQINAGPAQNLPTAITTTVWCVDYQLDVSSNSTYTTDVKLLSNVAASDPNVRYGTLSGETA